MEEKKMKYIHLIYKNAKLNMKNDKIFINTVIDEAKNSQKSVALQGLFISKRLWQIIQL